MAIEERFFDDLARGPADGSVTRGRALRLMGAAVVGGALGPVGIGEAGADPPGCKRNGKACTRNDQCCSQNCSSGSCQAQSTTTTTTTSTSTTLTSAAPMCIPNNGTCNTDNQCCTGICNIVSVGICFSCREAGGSCAAGEPCCAGGICRVNGTCCLPAGGVAASPTLTAVAAVSSITAYANHSDRFPNSLACTRSGHSTSVAVPGPSLCPYAAECVERFLRNSD